jgi:hypothetical protein
MNVTDSETVNPRPHRVAHHQGWVKVLGVGDVVDEALRAFESETHRRLVGLECSLGSGYTLRVGIRGSRGL